MTIYKKPIELNEQFQKALDIMENTSKHAFITGRAGTGKSTLLDYFRNNTKKNIVVLAPTGVAALNVKGQTIHSFFRFKPGVTLQSVKKIKKAHNNIYRELDAIVIDEVSMVRADLMDCIAQFLMFNGNKHNQPFGGVQMILIGDLYQLPPVVKEGEKEVFKHQYDSPFFFEARAMKEIDMEFIELDKVYRQRDESFINLLNTIRNNSITEEGLKILNRRYKPDFDPSMKDFFIWLTSTNEAANKINLDHLTLLKNEPVTYLGELTGDFKDETLPTQMELRLKAGAQVMLLNNEPSGMWVNGSIGKITDITVDPENIDVITVELSTGDIVDVVPHKWELFNYQYDMDKKQIESEVVGSFTQYPLRLAWAVTIHKSQGKTFERVVIDIGRGTFSTGQIYVALSRCTSLDGIVLKKPVEKKHIFIDWRVVKFVTDFQYRLSDNLCSMDDKIALIKNAIKDGKKLKIVYLKNNDIKSIRVITPHFVGEMAYLDKKYVGIEAFCHERNETRTFRIDRILEISDVN